LAVSRDQDAPQGFPKHFSKGLESSLRVPGTFRQGFNEHIYRNKPPPYPPVDRDAVYKEIFEQAENFKKYQKSGITTG
jgi:hypothetical protein